METLTLLIAAANEPFDQANLQARLDTQSALLLDRVSTTPVFPARLQRLLEEQRRPLKWMDAEDLVDALAKVIDKNDENLQRELLAMTVTVARLGSVSLAMRLGRKVIEEINKVAD